SCSGALELSDEVCAAGDVRCADLGRCGQCLSCLESCTSVRCPVKPEGPSAQPAPATPQPLPAPMQSAPVSGLQPGPCVPQCEGKRCGYDGCGGVCGQACTTGQVCTRPLDCEVGAECVAGTGGRFDLPANQATCLPRSCLSTDSARNPCLGPGNRGKLSECGRCPMRPPPAAVATFASATSATSPSLPSALLADLVPVEPPLREADLPAGIVRAHYATQGVGQTPGSFAVTHLGQASYTIPIEVPPGRGGLEPHLALTYDSSAGSNYMGVGWSLRGVGMITRCKRIAALDGYNPYDQNGAGDWFCLGGERLIMVDPNDGRGYGGDGVEYRTAGDLFTKIVSRHRTDWTAPYSFEVTTRDLGRALAHGPAQAFAGGGPGDSGGADGVRVRPSHQQQCLRAFLRKLRPPA
ncbi:MAG: hypothetical protein MJD61_16635, partial [Proteobacteria bacterium]|nr:hypothetical protein [Pseudomonadota bacterium]